MVYHQFFCYRQLSAQERRLRSVGSSGGKLFLYDTPEYKIPCSAAPNLRQIDTGCTGTVVLRHYDALPSGGIAPQICTAYRICIFIRSAGAFVPVLDNLDQVSDRARSIQAFSVWMGSHCGGVRNPFGGGRNHQQRTGDLCDADIRCHGAASGLQGCRRKCRTAVETHPKKLRGENLWENAAIIY